MDFGVLLKTMLQLFVLILIGVYIKSKNILNEQSAKPISYIVANILTPAMVLASSVSSSTLDNSDMIICLVLGVFLYAVFIVIVKIVIHLFFKKDNQSSIYQIMLVFSNIAFIGYPLLRVMYGEYAVFVFTVMHLPFNLLIYTYGVYLLSKDSIKKDLRSYIKLFLSPGVLASFVGLICFFTSIQLPTVLTGVFDLLGDATVPLSMIVVGVNINLSSSITSNEMFSLCKLLFLKLLLFPILGYLIVQCIDVSTFMKELLMFSFMLPSGSLALMLGMEYNIDVRISTICISLTTLISVVTIPLYIYLLF
ncbi:hypothetical protein EDD63_13914 [Breznakia blatticola]|uniref:Transporter n=1 Tax=Breznakia blatticola TaxID=1754012 RepID=A0A4R7ZCJ3_9FIRM|nr:AEC family transporter [Breznakia blatticola]TDW14566.1 hypothetical protein EDD63_13914 [Breznakia blatticola]